MHLGQPLQGPECWLQQEAGVFFHKRRWTKDVLFFKNRNQMRSVAFKSNSEPHPDWLAWNLIFSVIKAASPSPRSLKSPRDLLLRAQEIREGPFSAPVTLSPPWPTLHKPLIGCYCCLRAQGSPPRLAELVHRVGHAQGTVRLSLRPARGGSQSSWPCQRLRAGGPFPPDLAPSLPAVLMFSFLSSTAPQECRVSPPQQTKPLMEEGSSES